MLHVTVLKCLRGNFKGKDWSNTVHLCLSVCPVSQETRPFHPGVVFPFLKGVDLWGQYMVCNAVCACPLVIKFLRSYADLLLNEIKRLARIDRCLPAFPVSCCWSLRYLRVPVFISKKLKQCCWEEGKNLQSCRNRSLKIHSSLNSWGVPGNKLGLCSLQE